MAQKKLKQLKKPLKIELKKIENYFKIKYLITNIGLLLMYYKKFIKEIIF